MAKEMYVGVSETYTPVEYIESTGVQYIDTGIDALDILQNFKLVEEAQYSTASTRQQFGVVNYVSGTSSENLYLVPISIYENNFFVQMKSSEGAIVTSADTNLHTFITDNVNGKASVDSTEVSFAVSTTSTTHRNIFLFARNLNGTADLFCNKKVYSTKIYNGNTLIRDFIPVLDENNIACLFDKVENKFYYNKGTGSFIAGSTTGEPVSIGSKAKKIVNAYVGVDAVFEPVEYIESNGYQCIDTGIVVNNNTKIETEASFPPTTSFSFLFGTHSTGGSSDEYAFTNTDTGLYRSDYGGNRVTFPSGTDLTSKTTIIKNGADTTVGTTTITNTPSTFTTTYPLYIFGINEGGAPLNLASCKMYSFKIYENGNDLTMNLIPVLDKTSNKYCLFDLVSNKPYYSSLSDFSGGNSIGANDIEAHNLSRRILKGYVGVNGIARQFYKHKISYIESYGGQVIDTGVTMNANIRIVHTMSCKGANCFNLNDSNYSSYRCRWGSNGDNHIYYGWGYSNYPTSIIANIDDIYTFDLKQGSQKLTDSNGRTILSSNNSTLQYPTATIKINNNNAGKRIKTYSCQIYDGSTLIRDFVPMLDSNNRPCLYDKVNGTYYYNQGAGEFIYG